MTVRSVKMLAFLALCIAAMSEVSAQDLKDRGTLFSWNGSDAVGGPASMDEPLIGDRPDFTESSTTVGLGVKQVEMGYTYTFDSDGPTQSISHSYPEMLWRVGMYAEWLEFRIAYNFGDVLERTQSTETVNSSAGGEDLYLGFKIALTPQDGVLPETALVLQTTVASGDDVFSSGDANPGLNYIYSWALDDEWSLAGQTQWNRAVDGDTGRPYSEFSQSVAIGKSLDDKLGAYYEWYCLIPDGADSAPVEHYMDGGFTYSLNNNLQLDIRAGFGLNEESDDYFAGTGLIYRY
ncbi:MAG: transporter [Pirellulaceae bacterium]|nr:transporter [Pirellulales bacterium]HCA49982.1 hypothetical protein [Planctomycetaceae bacterium]